jgi:phospholipid/cholesterol/gamma-HCH transport system substrate-binding protein
MNESNNKPVIVGIFIFIGLAILAATIFTLGGQKKTFTKSFAISAIFNDVGGLQSGGNIWFSGVKVGTVKKISFHGDAQVQVTMSIENDAKSHIHKDSKAKISSDGLIGNKIIIIYGGTPSEPHVEENDFLEVENVFSTDDMLATLQVNNKNLEAITTDFKSISKKIDSGQGTLGTLLNDPTIAINLNKSAADLQLTLSNLKLVSEKSKQVMSDFGDFSSKLNKPGSSVNELLEDTLIYRNINKAMADLKKSTYSLNQFTSNLENTGAKLNQKDNAIGVLLNDPESATSIQTTLQNLETSSEKLDENLKALQHNFLFRRYFRKKAKLKD